MNKYILLFIILLCSASVLALEPRISDVQAIDFRAFCYHDVRNDVFGELDPDPSALNTQHLIQHFHWLKENGYTVISQQMVKAARNGQLELPKKSVLLSFDDGFKSFYHTIYPLLKLFNYPASFGIVTNWIENKNETIVYGNDIKTQSDFLTWAQIKEMSDSGLIEIASHSHDLHKGIIANPQSNTQPAATSRYYTNDDYENDAAYEARIRADLATSRDLIQLHTGKPAKTLIWPYGSYSEKAWQIAKSLGYEYSMTLGNAENKLTGDEHISRLLIDSNPSLKDFKSNFTKATHKFPQRVMHIDLDYVFDTDPAQQEINLGLMLDRVKKMSIQTVYLQAFSDLNGDGNAEALYFENNHLPLRSDLFNRAAWQLRTRTGVKVYAWMPVSAFEVKPELIKKLSVMEWHNGDVLTSTNNYKRLSIFKPEAREIIFSIYDSLAKYSKFAGILYHDDAFLTDKEDLSADALEYYRDKGLKFENVEQLVTDRSIAKQWASIKTRALIDFTNLLSHRIKQYLPEIKTARNIYALPITNPDSEEWFAQNFHAFIGNYDYTAVMAMPYMEKQAYPLSWLQDLARIVSRQNLPLDKIIFELQSKNWLNKQPISSQQLARQMQLLQQEGIANYGYYPDDFINDHPEIDKIAPHMSLATFPYTKK